jgi:predicted nucleic-acid-binding Zn-ribbon protein
MKATAVCPKCQSQNIAKVTHVADATSYYGSGDDLTTNTGRAPVARRLLASVAEHGSQKTTGDVEAYVCMQCGYFEEYLADPTKVDWKHVVGAFAYKKPGA